MTITYDERIPLTVYLVEGNNFEQLCIWREWAQDRKTPWKQHYKGVVYQVGELDKYPINVQLSWDEIAGQLVCFWEPVSQVIDIYQIEQWLKTHFVNIKRTSDCMNFGNIMRDIAATIGYPPWTERK